MESGSIIRWRAGSSHSIPDALARLLWPGPAADPMDDYFPDDAFSGERCDHVGPQEPIIEGILLKDLAPLEEGVLDPGGGRKWWVGVEIN